MSYLLKFLANGLPVIVLETGSGDAPYDGNGVANPGFKPARVATFATVEEVEDAQLHDTPPAPPEAGTVPDVNAMAAQIAALSEQLKRYQPAEAAAATATNGEPAAVTPAPAGPDPFAGLSTEQLQAALEARGAAQTPQG